MTVKIEVHFYSYLKEIVERSSLEVELTEGSTINELFSQLARLHPKIGVLANSILFAVGVEYQGRSYLLKEGDKVSLFPPVQGG